MSSHHLASPIREAFMDAWNDMYLYVDGCLKSGGISLQELETSIWIEMTLVGGVKSPVYFYDARDLAITAGWKLPE